MAEEYRQFGVKLKNESIEELDQLASKQYRSRQALINLIIDQYLESQKKSPLPAA